MLQNNVRRFDLYDFFSVFIPGVAFLIGLALFLPEGTNIGSLQLLLPLIVGGIVFGRAIHTVAILGENRWGLAPHRVRFSDEIMEPNLLTEETVERFCEECKAVFGDIGLGLENGRATAEDSLDTLYVATRSFIHIDSRGRSRTFQAIYSFHRSMWVVAIMLTAIYYVYAVANSLGWTGGIVPFTTYVGSLDISLPYILLAGAVFTAAGHVAFRKSKAEYQEYFIQYLIVDFLVLVSDGVAVSPG